MTTPNSTQIYRWITLKEKPADIENLHFRDAETKRRVDVTEWKYNALVTDPLPPHDTFVIEWNTLQVLEEIKTQERETPEQVLRKYFKTKDTSDIHWMPEVIQAMEEYANQFYTSVPVSEEEKKKPTHDELCELAADVFKDIPADSGLNEIPKAKFNNDQFKRKEGFITGWWYGFEKRLTKKP